MRCMLHLLEKENFGRNPYRKRGPRCDWEDNIKRNPQENGWDDVDCDKTHTKGQWGDFVKTVMKQQITSSSLARQPLVGPGLLKKLCPFVSVEGDSLPILGP